MRCYKIQQTPTGYSVAVSVDGGKPFIEGDFRDPVCFKYLVASWIGQPETKISIAINHPFRPAELSEIVKFAKGIG